VQLQRAAQDPAFGAGTLRISLLSTAAQVSIEQRDLGETFDRVAADFAALNLNPRLLLLHQRPIFVALAYGRIEQVLAAPADRGTAALEALAAGDRALRRADTPSAEYEAARLRARALTAQGLDAGAITQVRAVGSLADAHGWPHRVDWLRWSSRRRSATVRTARSARPAATPCVVKPASAPATPG